MTFSNMTNPLKAIEIASLLLTLTNTEALKVLESEKEVIQSRPESEVFPIEAE
jgi:hypothetical protein